MLMQSICYSQSQDEGVDNAIDTSQNLRRAIEMAAICDRVIDCNHIMRRGRSHVPARTSVSITVVGPGKKHLQDGSWFQEEAFMLEDVI